MTTLITWLTDNAAVLSLFTLLFGGAAGYLLGRPNSAQRALLAVWKAHMKEKQDRATREQLQELLKDL